MTTLLTWFRQNFALGPARGPETDEVWALTQQFHVTLRAYITKVEDTATDPPPKALLRIRELTSAGDEKKLSWRDAYDIEQQLIQLYDASMLKVELERRLLEADASLHSSVSQWYRNRVEKVVDREERRTLLARLVNDLQWRYTRNEARRTYTKQVTGRTELVFIASVALLLSVLFGLLSLFVGNNNALDGNQWGLIPFVGRRAGSERRLA